MMARALEVGIDTGPSCEEAVPIGVVVEGTASNHPSSCRESCDLTSEYQLPAWLASREPIMVEEADRGYKREVKRWVKLDYW